MSLVPPSSPALQHSSAGNPSTTLSVLLSLARGSCASVRLERSPRAMCVCVSVCVLVKLLENSNRSMAGPSTPTTTLTQTQERSGQEAVHKRLPLARCQRAASIQPCDSSSFFFPSLLSFMSLFKVISRPAGQLVCTVMRKWTELSSTGRRWILVVKAAVRVHTSSHRKNCFFRLRATRC